MSNFEKLRSINVNDKVEKKNDLSYLSWAWAWDTFKKECPDALYYIVKNSDGLPYFANEAGVMVYTNITVDGVTQEMWLPVMDAQNKTMKSLPYTYMTKKGERTVEAFTMFDVNKTLMRCLVKNMAIFGLGLYIYAGEDLPEAEPVDAMPWLLGINQAASLDALKQAYFAGVAVCRGDKDAMRALDNAKDKRKVELTPTMQVVT